MYIGLVFRSLKLSSENNSNIHCLIFENWSVIKFEAGLEQDLKSLKLKDLTGEFDPGSE